ncbi:dihydroxyacetone kinase [Cristinia sonorae]|uniref:Dihydroxyacetone kinase n=1 Tax=Cristinia sonorae TaxID=1940300 RepID=A0A8K0UI92_9AGAR|nr:dihydroxyacetone kinase [Cristinia sonorae]
MSIQSKHFLNTPESLVLDSLQGLVTQNPHLSLDAQNKVVYLTSRDRSKVALICGGGSGHEPAHAGFVGKGILAAAVCGNVFASPNPSQVKRGIELVENDKGLSLSVIIIVKNYTGDVLNFGLAKEQYAAQHPEKADRARFLIVGDDVAVSKSQGKIVGRRGLAGTVLVYKIAGALAERGGSLDQVYNVADWVSKNVATIGVGLEHCHVPGTAATQSHLSDSEIEIGMGIHNEPGNRRLSPVPPLGELVKQLLENVMSTTDTERSFVPFKGKGDRVVLLVNNLGGMSELELGGLVGEATKGLQKRGATVERVIAGTFMTSLNMPGFSLTVLLLPDGQAGAPTATEILELLDDTPNAPGWKWSAGSTPGQPSEEATTRNQAATTEGTLKIKAEDPKAFISAVQRACEALVKEEPEITRMDNIAGDGDCGLTLKDGAQAVLREVEAGRISGDDIVGSLIAISRVAEEQMGGTSGALYSIFFAALAQGFQLNNPNHSTQANLNLWTASLTSALTKLYTYTRARPPSRTLVDPLDAFITTVSDKKDLVVAIQAAADAALQTRDLEAKAGRSAYVEGDRLRTERVPDPGAWGVRTILDAFRV